MAESTQHRKFQRLVQKFEPQSKLIRVWGLKGGVSAQTTKIEIRQPDGQSKKLVVRRHGPGDLERNSNITTDEFRLLRITGESGLPTPTPSYLDTSCEIFPTPYLVLDYVDGDTEFAPPSLDDFLLESATQLSRIHRADISNADLSFLPSLQDRCAEKIGTRPAKLDESIGEGRIREALESVWPWTPWNEAALMHGDFWPGNILWKDGRVAAVIDWEDAELGDPLADLAISRLEILTAFGIDAMKIFTERYESMMSLDFTNLPIWDLYAALRPAFRFADWAEDDVAERAMREGHRLFVAQAFETLSARH